MSKYKVELVSLFELIQTKSSNWKPDVVLGNIIKIGKDITNQLDTYKEGKYRHDKNEVVGFFEAMKKFADTGLPISLDHLHSLISDYKKRILPYPHYSGIQIELPELLRNE